MKYKSCDETILQVAWQATTNPRHTWTDTWGTCARTSEDGRTAPGRLGFDTKSSPEILEDAATMNKLLFQQNEPH
jgi:hypothetical protein